MSVVGIPSFAADQICRTLEGPCNKLNERLGIKKLIDFNQARTKTILKTHYIRRKNYKYGMLY